MGELQTSVKQPRTSRWSRFWQGFHQATPIMLGYGPIGFAYGVLARQGGLTLGQTIGMSIFVYAGSAQFIAVGMFAVGAGLIPIVVTTFLVNLRHLLMTAALSPHLKGFSRPLLGLLAFHITDETFALHSNNFASRPADAYSMFGLNLASYLMWVTSSAVGGLIGNSVVDPARFGLDFALPAMFIALLCLQVKNRLHIFIAIIAGVTSILVACYFPGNWNVITATVVAATIGLVIEQWKAPSS
ncbi:MAG: AzlC family ABC transporter permease [Limnochordia bacterium]